jgi:hypothetical protein
MKKGLKQWPSPKCSFLYYLRLKTTDTIRPVPSSRAPAGRRTDVPPVAGSSFRCSCFSAVLSFV